MKPPDRFEIDQRARSLRELELSRLMGLFANALRRSPERFTLLRSPAGCPGKALTARAAAPGPL